MTDTHPRILVVGLGNDILGDDAVGLLAARRLRVLLPDTVDVVESGGGLDLLDIMEGYDCALLVDAIVTGRYAPGTILEFSADDLRKQDAPSPHYAGLPTVLQLSSSLHIQFPERIQIVAIEIENPYEVHEGLTARVSAAVSTAVERAHHTVTSWLNRDNR